MAETAAERGARHQREEARRQAAWKQHQDAERLRQRLEAERMQRRREGRRG